MNRIRLVAVFILFLLSVGILNAADTFDGLKSEYDSVMKSGTSRVKLTGLGVRFHKLYSSSPTSENADYALLFAGKSYKSSYELYANNADMDMAIKYLRIASTNYNSPAAAEAYLESAELFILKKDLVSAKFALNRTISRFPGTIQELAATSMLSDIEMMAKKSSSHGTVATVVTPASPSKSQAIVTPKTADAGVVKGGSDPIGSLLSGTESGEIVAKPSPKGTTSITGIRHFSADDYTRIVIDLSQNTNIDQHWLAQDKPSKMPPRLFIDIFDSAVAGEVPKEITIKDGVVSSVRWAYNKPGVTRVVLDSQSIKDFTVFQMANPSRIVIDVSTDGKKTVSTAKTGSANSGVSIATSVPIEPSDKTLVDIFGLKVKTIVIDPGHGGADPGCVHNGLKEKDIVLDIAKELRDLFKKHNKDINVYLTRDKDVFIPLEERTAIANKYKADLFISIHVNAAKNKNAKGIETYVLNVTNDKAALEVAALENQATTKSISDLQGILKDIMLSSKLEESLLLAASVQNSITSSLKTAKKENLGVKQAPFYVLVGAKMPAILIEAGFLSNKEESKKLSSQAYRKSMAKGIHDGINAYIKKYNK